jgi:hypothetical protein
LRKTKTKNRLKVEEKQVKAEDRLLGMRKVLGRWGVRRLKGTG